MVRAGGVRVSSLGIGHQARPAMDAYQRRGSAWLRAAWESGAVKGEAAKPERSSP